LFQVKNDLSHPVRLFTNGLLRPNFILAGLFATADSLVCICSGVSACFAVKLFKSWLSEKDINSVSSGLRKVGIDSRLMVRMTRLR